jgi:hypothetical protein
MIPRYQKVVFGALLIVSIGMAVLLVRQFEKAHERLLKGTDAAPTTAPEIAPAETATLVVANDMDGSLVTEAQSLPLPKDAEARARAVLGKLLDIYAADGAMHPVPATPKSVLQVFLLSVPNTAGGKENPARRTGELAVVNLAEDFANGHPSGILAETLTVESICATLHANLPQVTEVRFLVDGQPRATLAGHADLTRTYLAGDVISNSSGNGSEETR